MKAHLHLIDYALSKGCQITVGYMGEIDLHKSTVRSSIVQAAEACDATSLHLFDSGDTYLGFALVVNDNTQEHEEYIADHSLSAFLNEWSINYEQGVRI
jgi:hypothetical protein